jgi:hypothetical protein
VIRLVDRERARPRDPHVVEHAPVAVEAQHDPAVAVRDVDVAARARRRALGLDEQGGARGLGRGATGQEAGASVGQPVEHADAPVAIEGGDEELAARAAGADLGVDERRAVEEAGLVLGRQPRAARRDAVERGEVVELAAAVASAGARQVEGAGRIDREGRRGGDAAATRAGVAPEALAGDIDAGGEARREQDVGERGGGSEDEREPKPEPKRENDEPPRPPPRPAMIDHGPRS